MSYLVQLMLNLFCTGGEVLLLTCVELKSNSNDSVWLETITTHAGGPANAVACMNSTSKPQPAGGSTSILSVASVGSMDLTVTFHFSN